MPIYLCKPGINSLEPWRHGIPVYAHPYPLHTSVSNRDETVAVLSSNNRASNNAGTGMVMGTGTVARTGSTDGTNHAWNGNATRNVLLEQRRQYQYQHQDTEGTGTRTPSPERLTSINNDGEPILPSMVSQPSRTNSDATTHTPQPCAIRRIRHSEVILVDDVIFQYSNYWLRLRWPGSNGGFAGYVCLVAHTNIIKSSSAAGGMHHKLSESNSISGPSAVDDSADPDDDVDETPISPTETSTQRHPFVSHHHSLLDETDVPTPGFYAADSEQNTLRCLRNGLVFPSSRVLTLLSNYDDGVVPPITIPLEGQHVFCRICRDGLHDDDENGDTEAGENPLLAPCECSGSMAFVHYLCVEQWRCRSRHPEARNGTHCETCSKPYVLPPPSSRPVSQVEEEWLEAMPPHVMAALRQPHIGWQVGAALVRRRWFRPLAPIIVSPLVALYCRARRLLKKRGVSRRRWACSLCRRRARWKCVRCLRSYYCSRQCQNVSWHIVHKHVCYKPSRFWWSVVVYGGLMLMLIPGIVKDPLLYDLAFSFIPPSFYITAVLAGGLASLCKRIGGVDVRGRALELMVVVATAWLVYISWGVVWGMFGQPEACVGVVGVSYEESSFIRCVERFVLQPARTYFMLLDKSAMRYDRVRKLLCTSNDGGCFPHLSKASPEHLLASDACVGDVQLVSGIWMTAGATLALSALVKKRRRGQGRPHQD